MSERLYSLTRKKMIETNKGASLIIVILGVIVLIIIGVFVFQEFLSPIVM